jgi:hypothetical protein
MELLCSVCYRLTPNNVDNAVTILNGHAACRNHAPFVAAAEWGDFNAILQGVRRIDSLHRQGRI